MYEKKLIDNGKISFFFDFVKSASELAKQLYIFIKKVFEVQRLFMINQRESPKVLGMKHCKAFSY